MSIVRRLAEIRIVQFAVLGGLLFAVSAATRRDDRRIAFTSRELAALHAAEASRRGGAATGEVASEVDRRAIEDEILYREGLRRGFDRDDTIVRQRVIQRTLFFAEEMAGASEPPAEAELRAYYERTRARWTVPARHDFTQRLARDRTTVAELADHPERSAPSPVPLDASMTHAEVVALLGEPFAAALAALPIGATAEISSPFGVHLVTARGHVPERAATFVEALPRLRLACAVDRRRDAIAAMLGKAFPAYEVTIDGAPVAALTPTGRIAQRRASSAED